MDTATSLEWIDAADRLGDLVAAFDASVLDRAGCERAVAAIAGLRRRLDACEVRVARRLKDLADADPCAPPAEDVLAAGGRTDARAAEKVTARAGALDDVPQLAAPLDAGDASGEHVDAVAGVLKRFTPQRRTEFGAQHGDALGRAAGTATPRELRELAVSLAQRFERDAEALSRFDQQRRANRLRLWPDRATGMVRISGQLDPERGQALIARLRDEVEARFHAGIPDTAPDDPFERQDHLRALALTAIVLGEPAVAPCGGPAGGGQRCAPGGGSASSGTSGGSGGSGVATRRRPETITVIDLRTTVDGWHDESYVDLGVDGLELPITVIVDRALRGNVVPVVVDPAGVVVQVGDPPQPLDLGRTTRLANRAQRRALRVMYPRCAIPGCPVRFEHCEPHHITWWRHGGTTDLRNLLPLCVQHHHHVHDHGWVLTLACDRSLTVARPDGTVLHTGPPRQERGR